MRFTCIFIVGLIKKIKRVKLIPLNFVTAFKGHTISYGLRFLHFNLWPSIEVEKQGAVTYRMDRENHFSKMLACLLEIELNWKAH